MTDLIDTYLLKSGMEKHELCAIQHRRVYYAGISIFTAIAVLSLILTIFAPLQA